MSARQLGGEGPRAACTRRPWRAAAAVALLAGCTPPEAARERGGGPGADPGNHGAVIWMHGGSKIYHDTPCVTTLPECTGPEQASGFRTARID